MSTEPETKAQGIGLLVFTITSMWQSTFYTGVGFIQSRVIVL
jgi:hypothetical protein